MRAFPLRLSEFRGALPSKLMLLGGASAPSPGGEPRELSAGDGWGPGLQKRWDIRFPGGCPERHRPDQAGPVFPRGFCAGEMSSCGPHASLASARSPGPLGL